MTDKEKIEKAVALITELIEVAELKDDEHKKEAIRTGKFIYDISGNAR